MIYDLGVLADELSRTGLGEFVCSFNPQTPRQANWRNNIGCAPEGLQPLIRLFLLGEAVNVQDLPERIQATLDELEMLNIIDRYDQNLVSMNHGLITLPLLGRWLICQPPNPNPSFYLGDDSIAFLARILPRVSGTCLDLCAGPGTLGIFSAGVASRVVMVELDQAAAELAAINVRLNRLSDRVEVHQGDLFEPVKGLHFDTIIANPPLLAYPESLPDPYIGHGGADGLRVTRRILAGLRSALSETGTAHIIGSHLGTISTKPLVEALESIARPFGLTLNVSVLARQELKAGIPYFEALIATLMIASGQTENTVRRAFSDLLKAQNASHVSTMFIHASLGPGQVNILDFSHLGSGIWFK